MFDFIKKLFGFKPTQIEETVEIVKTASKRVKKLADVNKDGVVNVDDVKEAKKRLTKKLKEIKKLKEVADVNNDDVVNVDDVKEAVKAVSKKIKKPVAPKSVVKPEIVEPPLPKKRGRKPKAK
jgi:hypothetical protein